MFQQVSSPGDHQWKHRYYSTQSMTEFQKLTERKENADQFVMQMDGVLKGKQFRIFPDKEEAFQYVIQTPKEQRCFYETIFDCHLQKPKFDIDIKKSILLDEFGEKFHEEIIEIILCAIQCNVPSLDPQDDIAVYQSHGQDKYSYHIVLTNYYVTNHLEALSFAKQIIRSLQNDSSVDAKTYKLISECIDLNVYKNLQQFRLLFCSKMGKNRYKTRIEKIRVCGIDYIKPLEDDKTEFDRSLITNVDLDTMIQLDVSMYHHPEEEKPFLRTTGGDPSITPEDVWITDVETICDHVAKYHLPSQFSECGSLSHHPSVQGNMIMLRCPAGGYPCKSCARDHEQENPFLFLKVNRLNKSVEVCFNCRRNSDGKIDILCGITRDLLWNCGHR